MRLALCYRQFGSSAAALLISSTSLAPSRAKSSFQHCLAATPRLRYSWFGSFSSTARNSLPGSSSSVRRMSSAADDDATTSILRVGLLQFPVTEDKATNQETAKAFITKASSQGAQLVVLPEIWNSPYATAAFPDYAEPIGDSDCNQSPSFSLIRDLAIEHKLWIVGGSIPEICNQKYYNTCCVFDPSGVIVAKHRKVHLFDIDVPGGITFIESDTLTGGDTVSHFTLTLNGNKSLNVGLGICYDVRFAEYAQLLRQKHDCSLLIYPGAFNMVTGPAHWELLQRARALDNQCFVLTASPARRKESDPEGKYPPYTAWGHSSAISPWGDVIATTEETPDIVIADLDLDRLQQVRQSIPIGKQVRTDLYQQVKYS